MNRCANELSVNSFKRKSKQLSVQVGGELKKKKTVFSNYFPFWRLFYIFTLSLLIFMSFNPCLFSVC